MKFSLDLSKKIYLLCAVPFAAFLFLLVLNLKNYSSEVAHAKEMKVYLVATEHASAVINDLQVERGLSASYLSGGASFEAVQRQRDKVDKRFDTLISYTKEQQLGHDLYPHFKDYRAKTADNRKQVDSKVSVKAHLKNYTKVIHDLLEVYHVVADMSHVGSISAKVISVEIIELAKESAGILRASLTSVLSKDQPLSDDMLQKIIEHKSGIDFHMFSDALELTPRIQEKRDSLKSRAHWVSVYGTYQHVLKNKLVGNYGKDPKAFFGEVSRVVDDIAELIQDTEKATVSEVERFGMEASTDFWWTSLLSGLFTAFMILQMLWHVRQITKPVNSMVSELMKAGEKVGEYSDRVATTSQEIAEVSTEQASAVQESMSAIQEISSMISRTAEYSRDCDQITNQAKVKSDEGRESANTMVESMKSIEASNQSLDEISDVIDEIGRKTVIINDIVFKTQLLSFNAAIEAARAGEHGKGFAVVSEEIGNLAKLSGDAAQEIGSLLDDSRKQVGSAVDQIKEKVKVSLGVTSQSAQNFTEIAGDVDSVSKKVQDITVACNEQDEGIKQTSIAIQQMDEASRQQKEVSVSSMGVSKSLKQESVHLGQITSELIRLVLGNKAEKSLDNVAESKKSEKDGDGEAGELKDLLAQFQKRSNDDEVSADDDSFKSAS